MRLIKRLLPSLGDVTMVSLDIDQSEDEQTLRRYGEAEGFDWRHALASKEILNDLASRYGTGIIFPPSDTTIFIDPAGTPHAHPGQKDERTLRDLVARYSR